MFIRIVLFYILVIFGFNVFGVENSDLKGFVNKKFYGFSDEVERIEGKSGNDIKDFQYVGGGEIVIKKDNSGSTWAIFEVTKNENTKFIYVKNINSILDDNPYDYGLFQYCMDIRSITVLCCNTRNVKGINRMFCGCSKLETIKGLENFDTNNVERMNSVFFRCSSLSSLPDISEWNTSKVTSMSGMFYGCSSLTELPAVYKWNTRGLKNSDGMFDGCPDKDCCYKLNSNSYRIFCCNCQNRLV